MNNILKLIIFLSVLGFLGCESKDAKKSRMNGIGFNYVQDIVKNEFRDPESTQFRNQKGFCGEVNTKNGMGGYVGFQKFILLKKSSVVIQNEINTANKQFQKAWDEICSKPFEFKDEKVIEPNFKMPEPVYDQPRYTVEHGSITATPKSLAIKQGIYIYPELSITCNGSETRFTLLSYKSSSYENNDLISLSGEKPQSMILVPFTSNDWVQQFSFNGEVGKLLKTSSELTIFFKSLDGSNSMQTYDAVELKRLMRMQSNNCGWANI